MTDHGETLYDHECWFDHHGLYDCTLAVPLIFRFPGKVPAGARLSDYCQLKDVTPTILELLGIRTKIRFNGRSLTPLMMGKPWVQEPEMYITECTWMRKHGWRQRVETDRRPQARHHFKPSVELRA